MTRRNDLRTPEPSNALKGAVVLVAIAFLLQSLAPPGFMAGSVADGWPVVLCPEGLPEGFLGSSHGHHQHEAEGRESSVDGQCLLGGVLDGTILETPVTSFHQSVPGQMRKVREYAIPTVRLHYSTYLSRAPPAV